MIPASQMVSPDSVERTAHAEAERVRVLATSAKQILLLTHIDPDGDAIGSLLGLGWILKSQGCSVSLACESPVPGSCTWLPGSDEIARASADCCGGHDLIISLDCSDIRRTGLPGTASPGCFSPPLINLDHHVTNTRFGAVNVVDPSCVATAQLVLSLADAFGWPIGQPAALCLLTGIVTDTRGLRTANVDAQVVGAVLRLVEAGAPLAEVTHRMLDQRPLSIVRLWGEAIASLQLEDGILWTEITGSMLHRHTATGDGMTGLSNFLAGVSEARAVVVFSEREDNGDVDVGLRAAPGYDVSDVAFRLGGGGHPQASGCTLKGSLSSVRSLVLEEVRRSLADQEARAGREPCSLES